MRGGAEMYYKLRGIFSSCLRSMIIVAAVYLKHAAVFSNYKISKITVKILDLWSVNKDKLIIFTDVPWE